LKRTVFTGAVVLVVVAATAFALIALFPDRCERLFDRYSAQRDAEVAARAVGGNTTQRRYEANQTRIEANEAGCDTGDWVPRLCEELRIEYREALSDYDSDPTNPRVLGMLLDSEQRAREVRCAWLRAFQEFLTEPIGDPEAG
jgi:hypothetical protein